MLLPQLKIWTLFSNHRHFGKTETKGSIETTEQDSSGKTNSGTTFTASSTILNSSKNNKNFTAIALSSKNSSFIPSSSPDSISTMMTTLSSGSELESAGQQQDSLVREDEVNNTNYLSLSSQSESFATPTTPVGIRTNSESMTMAYMTPDDRNNSSTITTNNYNNNEGAVETEEIRNIDTEGSETVVTFSMQSFKTAHASFPISPSPIKANKSGEEEIEQSQSIDAQSQAQVQDMQRERVLNNIARTSNKSSSTSDPNTISPEQEYRQENLQPLEQQVLARFPNRQAQTIAQDEVRHPPTSIAYSFNSRTPPGLRPRHSVSVIRSRLGISNFSPTSPTPYHEQREQQQPYLLQQQLYQRPSCATTPSITTSATTRESKANDAVVAVAIGALPLKKSNSSSSSTCSSSFKSKPQKKMSSSLRFKSSSSSSSFSLHKKQKSNKNNARPRKKLSSIASSINSMFNNNTLWNNARSLPSIPPTTNSGVMNNGNNAKNETDENSILHYHSNGRRRWGRRGGESTSSNSIEVAFASSPNLTVDHTKTAVGALVARQMTAEKKTKTAVGTLVARQTNGGMNDDLDNGKMRASAAPSWRNSLKKEDYGTSSSNEPSLSWRRNKSSKRKKKKTTTSTEDMMITTNDFCTSYALLDDSHSHIPAQFKVDDGGNGDGDSSSSSSDSINSSSSQYRKNISSKTGSYSEERSRPKHSNGVRADQCLPKPSLLDEWSEYEKYQKEQELSSSDELSEDEEGSNSSRHWLFEPLPGCVEQHKTPRSTSLKKTVSSYDFSPVEDDIPVGGFCIRSENMDYVSDISYNTGMQSDFQPSHYVEVVAQNSGFSGASIRSAKKTTNYRFDGGGARAVMMDREMMRQQQPYPNTHDDSPMESINTVSGGGNNNPDESMIENDINESKVRWMSSDEDLLNRKGVNQRRQKEHLVMRLIRRLQDNSSLVHKIDVLMERNAILENERHAIQTMNPFLRTRLEKEGIIAGYSQKLRSDILLSLNQVLLKTNGVKAMDMDKESDSDLHYALHFATSIVKSASAYAVAATGDRWRAKGWFRRGLEVEEQSTASNLVASDPAILDHGSITPNTSNRSNGGGSSITTRLTPPELSSMYRMLAIVLTIVQKMTVALEESTRISSPPEETFEKVKKYYMQLLHIPNEKISHLNDGFSLCSEFTMDLLSPAKSGNRGKEGIQLEHKALGSVVKNTFLGASRPPWIRKNNSSPEDSSLLFPTVINIPNGDIDENHNKLSINVHTKDIVEPSIDCSALSLETREDVTTPNSIIKQKDGELKDMKKTPTESVKDSNLIDDKKDEDDLNEEINNHKAIKIDSESVSKVDSESTPLRIGRLKQIIENNDGKRSSKIIDNMKYSSDTSSEGVEKSSIIEDKKVDGNLKEESNYKAIDIDSQSLCNMKDIESTTLRSDKDPKKLNNKMICSPNEDMKENGFATVDKKHP